MIQDEENNYLINIENNLVNKEKIDIKDITFDKIMFLYNSALKEIKTKIDILQDELRLFHNYEPIEYITTRIKTPEHIIEKLKRKSYDLTYKNMFERINDIAGIRIVCNFKKDVYKLVEIIEDFQDIRILNKKDISNGILVVLNSESDEKSFLEKIKKCTGLKENNEIQKLYECTVYYIK